MSIDLVPLGTMTAELRPPIPVADRLIFEVDEGRIEGDRIRARMKGSSAADWFTVDKHGVGTVDVRALVETDDGALVFIQYLGRVDAGRSDAPIYIAPRFETGDERYHWLNLVQAVGKGRLDGLTLTYELYELA